MNLFEMLRSADGGRAFELMARQFKLSQEQVQLAIEALLPAFSQGLKRSAEDPYGFGRLMQAFAGGNYPQFFDEAKRAFSPQGIQAGNEALAALFGSGDLAKAVAAQAAQASGLAQQVIAQMMPGLAALLMGGLARQTAAPGAAGNPFQAMADAFMKGHAGAPRPEAPQPDLNLFANPFAANPFVKAMQEAFVSGKAATPKPDEQASAGLGANPWAAMFSGMMGAGAPKQEAPKASSAEQPANPFAGFFGEMFEAGARSRESYERSIAALFEEFRRQSSPRG